MKLVGDVPSSSTYTRKWRRSTNWQGKVARHENEQQDNKTTMGRGQEVLENGGQQGNKVQGCTMVGQQWQGGKHK